MAKNLLTPSLASRFVTLKRFKKSVVPAELGGVPVQRASVNIFSEDVCLIVMSRDMLERYHPVLLQLS